MAAAGSASGAAPQELRSRAVVLLRRRPLATSVGNTALGEVVGRELDGNRVAAENANIVFAHFARNMGRYDVPVFQPYAERGVGKGLDDRSFHLNVIFFGHALCLLER